MFKHRITVFTSTYNRAQTLPRLYKSLQQQTFLDFEWLVIDDGSVDHTEELFANWSVENNRFSIRYYYQNNGGKHTAINYGLEEARGKLFFTADSDDFLTPDALFKIDLWVSSLPPDQKFCGVAGNWGSSAEQTPNTLFKGQWRDASLLERYPDITAFTLDGERAFVFFTDIHRRYRYPEFKNEKFITEAVSWNRMAADGYKIRVYNDIIYVYKFLPGGLSLSGSKIFVDNPKGFGLWLREKAEFCNYGLIEKFKMYYSYYASQHKNLTVTEIAYNIGTSSFVIIALSGVYLCKSLLNNFVK